MSVPGSIHRWEQNITEALEHSDYQRLKDQLCSTNHVQLTEIKAILERNEWILPRVCELGFIDILQQIYTLHVIDINASHLGKTGLQYASQKGYPDIVAWLLDKGASLKEDVWANNSEFYLATLHGKQDVLDVLLSREPERISDSDVCYCLLFAACEGGHLALVKKWFSPDTDVTRKLMFTSNLDECEQDFPLFAACRGEHLEVAKFLVTEGDAILTKEICYLFPEFTTKLVRSLFLKSDTKGSQYFNMSNHRIETLLSCWFSDEKREYLNVDVGISDVKDSAANEESKSVFEIVINIEATSLLQLPDDVLWALKNLVSLNASHNALETISDAIDPGSLYLNSMKSVNLSNCQLSYVSFHLFSLPCLVEVNLSHNKLSTLAIKENTACGPSSKCSKLQRLDLSHNLLQSFPLGFKVFIEMTVLFVSHNQLEVACSPWQCPLKYLDLSSNKLRTFPPNADQFWGRSLNKLLLNHNQMTELPESIVKMRALTNLDVSHNRIQQMPASSLWRCPLHFLNLNNNNLGICENLEFPSNYLGLSLMELFMANNGLVNVPLSICNFERLYILDLSNNIKIKTLPPELGKLKNLYNLKVEGIVVSDGKLQKLLSSHSNEKVSLFASSITGYLERKYRKCVCQKLVKLVVLGCKSKDGHCIIQELTGKQNVRTSEHESMAVAEIALKKKVKLQIWELPDTKIASAILPCFLTLNSLYLIVHDVSNCGSDLYLVSEKVSCIQARVLNPYILIACLYSRLLSSDEQLKIKSKISETFPKAKFISVTFGVKEHFSALRQQIYSAIKRMTDVVYNKKSKLCQRQVPAKFLEVARKVKSLNQNVCRMEEFLQAVDCARKDLDDGIDQHLKLHEFLLQVGAMLHYNNHTGELSDLVILNPAWLFEILSKFLKSLVQRNHSKTSQLPLSSVKDTFKDMLPEGIYDYFPSILQLMEAFNIGLRLTDSIGGKEEVSLLIPSLLPKQRPQFQVYVQEDSFKASRLYRLPVIPSALWSHLISQLILVFGRLSSSKWKLGDHRSHTSFSNDKCKSLMTTCKTCSKGLHVINRQIQYWRSGIMIYYNQGHVMVEEVDCTTSPGGPSEPGILVTVQTSGSNQHSQDEHPDDNKKKLSVMGVVVDEIEEVLELFNPDFRDPTNPCLSQIYALCPHCYNIAPGAGSISLANIHFTVGDCAQMLLSKEAIVCQKGPSSLHCLVPEFLFMELPSEMHVSADDLVLTNMALGHGMAGAVTKAIYKGVDVAVKLFYDSTVKSREESTINSKYPNVADLNQKMDRLKINTEADQRKLIVAFYNVRREVGILSKLKHEYIVKFIGVCIRPQLLLVMELAPYGSLRKELERRTEDMCMDVEQMDRVITQTVFSKDLTYKIVLQIGYGLSYLHKNNIIYRDLKPDNILVMSLSIEDRVNVKLSDYGISKFNTLQGVTGLFGTIGYMAPEVLSKQYYTEKADIYSYAILMLEVLTGLPPSEHLQRPQWSNWNMNEATPAHVQGLKIHCHFPYFENLMKECWALGMDERPSAESIVKRMKSDQLLLLRDSITLDRNYQENDQFSSLRDSLMVDRSAQENLEITCIYACQTGGREKIWISESGQDSHRCISVYDVESSSFVVYRKVCPGPPVIGMAKVGCRIWFINKEQNYLDIIERSNESSFEISRGTSLEAKAIKILNHCYGSSEESKSIILVGLENGCLTMFHFSASNNTSVTAITNIELLKNSPVAEMCSCSANLLAVACGMTVYFQQVGLPENQGNVKPKMSKGTWIPELIASSSVSLKNITDAYNPVAAMTADGNAVWCCLENSPLVVKVDSDLQQLVLVITISWNSLLEIVRLEEVNIVSDSNVRLVASESGISSLTFRRESYTQANQLGQSQTDNDDVFLRRDFNENTAEAKQGACTELVVPAATSSPNILSSKQDSETDIVSDLGSAFKKTTLNRYTNKTTNNGPPLPPSRIVLERQKIMPELDMGIDKNRHIKPPLLPNRSGCQDVNINITSLQLCTDILVIGTSSNAIVLLQLIYGNHSGTSGCPPALPFVLPVLRHPETNKNVLSGHGLVATGSISTLTLACDKLVSLHCSCNQVTRRHQSTRRDNKERRRGVYNLETISQSLSKDDITDTNTPVNNDTTSQPGLLPSSTEPTTDLKSNVVDIAVWDNISWSRLRTIRSYGHNLTNCGGWCCRAPAPVSDT